MRNCVFLFIFIFSFLSIAGEVDESLKKMADGEEIISVSLKSGKSVEVILDRTSKGNGTMLLGDNTLIRIMDLHNDGFIYEGGYLNVDFVATSSNEFDVVVSGILNKMSDNGAVLSRDPIVAIYHYDGMKYHRNYFRSPIEIDLALE